MSKMDLSWLFGKQQPIAGGPPQLPTGDASSGDNGKGGSSGGDEGGDKKWSGFDPTGLERAAKAVRELEKSSTTKV